CFVTFFPQLIAGPIVLHSEFLPQLTARENRRPDAEKVYRGLALFTLGLSKKVLLADTLAQLVNAEYDAIAYLDVPSAWVTIIFYMLELYFDFSGYTDMARGIGLLFGFTLPENFNSPLMSDSVKDFWRRWHMTLSRFFGSYVYIPLGGNRRGKAIQCRNLLIVFLLSGLWHGAGWTFLVWGLMHGLCAVFETLLPPLRTESWKPASVKLLTAFRKIRTFLLVTLSFSVFRAASLQDAALLWKKLFLGGWNGMLLGISGTIAMPETFVIQKLIAMKAPGLAVPFCMAVMIGLLVLSILLIAGPRAEDWLEKKGHKVSSALLLAVLFLWSFTSLSQVSTFLYFDF
ncbi:MAG: MBOAT family protein, partial [Lachnospiraceae bacterium]|nr:MBOAT family protein [Lachnospiraceae bacterium]